MVAQVRGNAVGRTFRALIQNPFAVLVTVVAILALIAVTLAAVPRDEPFNPENTALQSPSSYTQSGSGGSAGSTYTWTRQTTGPATTYVRIEAVGASACTTTGCPSGALVSTVVPVTGDLTIQVGKRASGTAGGWGWSNGGNSSIGRDNNGTGGGGSTGVSSGASVLVVAAGAGGNGGYDTVTSTRVGGNGGTPNGAQGTPSIASSSNGQGGFGGTPVTAGAGGDAATGTSCNNSGSAGSGSGNGGNGATTGSSCQTGGGGGGGYTGGGGGGNAYDRAGGGGGGASFVRSGIGATSTSYSIPGSSTNPSVTITPLTGATAATQSVTTIATTSATISATVNGGGLPTAVSFTYGLSATLASGNSSVAATQSPVSGSTDTSVSAALSGLTAGTRYYYRVSASNGLDGTTDGSIMSFDTLPLVPVLGALTHGDQTLSIAWTRPTDGGVALQSWSVQQQNCTTAAAASCTGSWTDIAAQTALTGTSTSAVATGLTNGSFYRLRVAGVGSDGTGAYAVTAGTEYPSTKPNATTTTATNITGTTATLNADAGSGGSATSSVVFQYSPTDSTAQSGPTITATPSSLSQTATGTTTLSADITGLTTSTRYYYRASLTNRDGTTRSTPVMTLDTVGVPGAPTIDSVTPVADGLTVAWTPGPVNGSAITDWSVQQCSLSSPAVCESTPGGWASVAASPGLTAGSVSTTATGIYNGTRYWIRIAATSALGQGPYTNSALKYMPLSNIPSTHDRFAQGGNPPTGSLTNTDLIIYPLANGATDAKTIQVSATDLDGKSTMSSVNLCLYYDDPSVPTANGNCSTPDLDPANQVLLTWTEATDDFSVSSKPVGSSAWSIDPTGSGGVSNLNSGDQYTLDLTFSFHASQVMREAPVGKWKVALYINDDTGQFSEKPASNVTITVHNYSQLVVQRQGQSFGTLEFGGVGQANNVSTGTVVANGPTDITYRLQSDFVVTGYAPLANITGALDQVPGIGEVSYLCTPDSSYTNTNAVRIPTSLSPVVVETSTTLEGTTEAGDSNISQSCQLQYGGQTGVPAGSEFSAPVIAGTQAHQ